MLEALRKVPLRETCVMEQIAKRVRWKKNKLKKWPNTDKGACEIWKPTKKAILKENKTQPAQASAAFVASFRKRFLQITSKREKQWKKAAANQASLPYAPFGRGLTQKGYQKEHLAALKMHDQLAADPEAAQPGLGSFDDGDLAEAELIYLLKKLWPS